MDSKLQPTRPVIIILTRDEQLSGLADTLWSSDTDSLTVSLWAEAQKTLQSSQTCLAVVDGDMPAAELAQIRVELPGSHVRGVLWLTPAGSDPGRALLLAPDSVLLRRLPNP
jgi:hypothetical protein